MVGQQKEKMIDIDTLRPPEPAQRNKSSWTNDEQLLAVQGKQRYFLLFIYKFNGV